MEAYGKNWSFTCKYRFGTQAFVSQFQIYQTHDFQIATAIYNDGLMHSGYAPEETITLALVLDKEGTLSLNRKPMKKNEILILDDKYKYETVFSHRTVLGVLSLKKERVDQCCPYLHQLTDKVFLDTQHKLRDLFDFLNNDNIHNREDIHSMIIDGVSSLALHNAREVPKMLSKKEKLIFQIRDHILEHIEEPISIDKLAYGFGMSERTMQTGFKKLFGFTPKKFIKLLKLNYAYEDLVKYQGNKKVSEVSMKYGFKNFGLFSQEYKKLYGFLPSLTR